MFYEYAVDPECMRSWQTARYLLEGLQPQRGRLIAAFPKDWLRSVYQSLEARPVEKKRIKRLLEKFSKQALLRRGRSYEPDQSWLENAERAHARLPFRGIIAPGAREGHHHLDSEELSDDEELWESPPGQFIARHPQRLEMALGLLLDAAPRVILVDPYFCADQGEKLAMVTPLLKRVVSRGAHFEIVFAEEHIARSRAESSARRALRSTLGPGETLSLRSLREKRGGDRLHNRFLLTDFAGVKFGDSVEKGPVGQTDHLSILDEKSRRQLWERYTVGSSHFEQVGATIRVQAEQE